MSLLPSTPDTTAEDTEPRVVGVDDEDADALLSALSSGTARALLSALHEEPAPPSDLADRADTSLQNAQYHLEKLEDAGAVEVVDTAYSAKGREMDVYAPADQPLVIFAGEEEKQSSLRAALSRFLGAVGLLGVASLAIQQWFGEGGLLGGSGPASDGESGAASGPAPGGDNAGAAGTPTPDGASTPQGPELDGATSNATAEPTSGDVTLQQVNETADTAAETAGALTPGPESTPSPETTTTAAADTVREAGAGLPPGLLFFLGGLFVLAVVAGLFYLRE
jgi:DNA-binding transcriptional ArsR family regulator